MTAESAAWTATPAADAAPLRLRDLGSMVIEVAGVSTAVRWHKPAQILATLLVNPNQRVTVDTLLDVVWSEQQVSKMTVGTLESHIWRLRKLMEPNRSKGATATYLVNDRGGYRLVVNTEHADSLRFAELAAQGDLLLAAGDASRALPRYEQALSLWRGRPFDAIADGEWASASVARLDELYGQVNEQLVEALLRTNAAEAAIGMLEALIAGLPFRERLWRQLMQALYQVGRVEESLGAYQRARETLLDNLGLDPGPELRDLHQRILDQDPALSRQLPAKPITVAEESRTFRDHLHLPALRSELVGRDEELVRLIQLVRRTRLVTLIGAGGAGKTRLGIEVARAAADLAPDGVWFVDLAATDDPESVPEFVLSTIGISEPTAGTPLSTLRHYVRDRQVLLLIDNCEHVIEAVRLLLDAVLADDTEARVLATSREPIGTDGEVLWTLAPLPVSDDPGAEVDELSPAGRLFLSKAQIVDATFEADAAALTDIEAICAAVDGIPLAIELAAGRVRSASLSEVRRQVRTALGELSRIGYTRIEHHRTVELSIAWSVRLLGPAERAAHRRLSTLPGSFTVEAARAVLNGSAPVSPGTEDLLRALVHRSLLDVVPAADRAEPTRFQQLATVRAHASSALVDSGELDDVLKRRSRWAQDLVSARPDFDVADTHNWYTRVARNHDTLMAVLHDTLVDRPDPIGVHLLGQLAHYWAYQRRMSECERWSQLALHQSGATARDLALVELQLACSFAYRNRADLAVPLVRSAIGRADTIPRREYAHFLATAAWCAHLRGDSALDFVADEIRQVNDNDAVAVLWAELLTGTHLLKTAGPSAALSHAEALVGNADAGGSLPVAWLASSLAASSALLLKTPSISSTWLSRGLEYQRRIGNVREVGLLELQGNIATLAGDYARAAQLFAQSSTLTFREGSPWPVRQWTETALANVKERLTVEEFETAWKAGVTQAKTSGDSIPAVH